MAAETRPTSVRWIVVTLLSTAAAIAYLDRIIISNVVKEIQAELGLNQFQAGWVLAAFVIGYGTMQVPMGRLGDRRGIRFALPTIVVIWSLMTGLTPIAQSFALLFAIRCAFGMAQAGVFPLTVPAVRRWFPVPSRGFAQGVVIAATRVGAILAMLAAPILLVFGWKEAFVVCGSVGVVWAVLFAWYFRDRPSQHPAANQAEVSLTQADADEQTAPPKLPLSLLLRNANIWGMCLAQFFGAMGYYLYITWFPTYLRDQYGFDLGEAGLLAVVPHAGAFLGAVVGGHVLDSLLKSTGSLRWSRRGVWIAGKTGCGVMFLIAASLENPYLAVAVIGLGAFLADIAAPASWAMVSDVGRRHAGAVYGVQNTAGCVGAGICPLLVPWLVQWWGGWGAVLPVFAAVFFLSAASWLWVDATRPINCPEA